MINVGPCTLKGTFTLAAPAASYRSKGCKAQSVTCLATGASLTADPGVSSSIPARSHTFVEITK